MVAEPDQHFELRCKITAAHIDDSQREQVMAWGRRGQDGLGRALCEHYGRQRQLLRDNLREVRRLPLLDRMAALSSGHCNGAIRSYDRPSAAVTGSLMMTRVTGRMNDAGATPSAATMSGTGTGMSQNRMMHGGGGGFGAQNHGPSVPTLMVTRVPSTNH